MPNSTTVCRCGRVIGPKPHCIRCGSTNIYGLKSQDRIVKGEGGESFVDRAFNCRACSMPFRESMECNAPMTKQAERIQNDFPVVDESMRSVNEARRIKERLKSYTMTRIASGQRALTQDEEDDFQKRYGESLSQIFNMPIVKSEPIKEDIISEDGELHLTDLSGLGLTNEEK